MPKSYLRPKKFACFTQEQQEAYEKMSTRQRKYVEFRGQGYKKRDAYLMAGYDSKLASQAAYGLELKNPIVKELVECLVTQNKARELNKEDSALNKQIDALALQDGAEKILETIEGADGETARRIQFYRDVMNGKIKTVRKTTRYNAMGEKMETRVEEVSDVEVKMKARRELDRILGLNQIADLDKLQVGDITINIVDASKKEELEDSRNKVELDPDKVEIIDGEAVVVEEEKVEKDEPSEKDKFFNSVKEKEEDE